MHRVKSGFRIDGMAMRYDSFVPRLLQLVPGTGFFA